MVIEKEERKLNLNTRIAPYAVWAAYLSGILAILSAAFLILFFWLEAPQSNATAGPDPLIWGPLSDIFPIFQMLTLLVVANALYELERSGASGFSLITYGIGIVGMLGVSLLQLLLVTGVMPFEKEVGPVLIATAVVGVWLILINFLGWRQRSLPARMTWLGMAVGVALVLQPVLFSVLGGVLNWHNFMSSPLLLIGSALVFVLGFAGFPVWLFWLGRRFASNRRESVWRPDAAVVPGVND